MGIQPSTDLKFSLRKLRRANKIKSAYSSDGKILVRDKKDKKYQISDLDDLVQFGYVKKIVSSGGSAPSPSASGAGAMY